VFELIKIQKRIKNENEQQRHGPLEDMQKWKLERAKHENEQQNTGGQKTNKNEN
jgi:hypothetical protein